MRDTESDKIGGDPVEGRRTANVTDSVVIE